MVGGRKDSGWNHRLKRSKVKVWLDKTRLAGGDGFGDEIDAALQRIKAVAVLAGPSGIGLWQKTEIARAADRLIRDRLAESLGLLHRRKRHSCEVVPSGRQKDQSV